MNVVWLCRSPEIGLGSLDPTLRTALHKDNSTLSLYRIPLQRWLFETHVWSLCPVRNLYENSDNSFPCSFWLCFLPLFLETANSFFSWVHLWSKIFFDVVNGCVCGSWGCFLHRLGLQCCHRFRILCLIMFCLHSIWHHSVNIVVNILGSYVTGDKVEI